MKLSRRLLLLPALPLTTALTRADLSDAEAAAFCGVLGVMDVPAGVDPSTVRACREHPVRLLPPGPERHHAAAAGVEKRACFQGGATGCSKSGWCFKRCDINWSGPWCWTTKDGPLSDWKSCERNADCGSGEACGGGRCKDCGCSC